MENELVKVDSKGIIASVNDSVSKIKAIETKIGKSVKAAEDAKKSVKEAMNVERHWYQNTTARIVDKLQPAVKDIAKAVEVSVETQKLLFDHEQILANCCKSLFVMGASNIAATRVTVRQIKMQLENASEDEISEMARKELENVVAQLQMQEDLFNRQNKLGEKVKVVNAKVEGINDSLDEQERKIDAIKKQSKLDTAELKKADKQLAELVHSNQDRLNEKDMKDVEQDELLEEERQRGRERDFHLSRIDKKDEEHDRRLDEKDAKNVEYDRRLDENDTKDREHDLRLNEKDKKDEEHDCRLTALEVKDLSQDKVMSELETRILNLEHACADLNDKVKKGKKTGIALGLLWILAVAACIVYLQIF